MKPKDAFEHVYFAQIQILDMCKVSSRAQLFKANDVVS